MSLPSSSAGRSLVLAALVLLALAACGRRGRLEAPPDPIAVAAQQQRQAERDRVKAPRKGITIPKEPFILDPLL